MTSILISIMFQNFLSMFKITLFNNYYNVLLLKGYLSSLGASKKGFFSNICFLECRLRYEIGFWWSASENILFT